MSFGRLTIRSLRHLSIVAFAGLLGFCGLQSASAQTNFYWNGSNPAANPANGGTGNWDNITQDWLITSATGSQSAWVNGSGNNIANFAGTAGTVTVNAAVNAGTLNFNTTGYTVADNSDVLTLGGSAPTINVGSGTGSSFTTSLNLTPADFSVAAPGLTINNTLTGTSSSTNVFNLGTGSSAYTLGGTLTINGSTNASSKLEVVAQNLSLNSLAFTASVASTNYLTANTNLNATILSTGTLTMTGATPTISVGSTNNLATPGFIYENITSANNLLVQGNCTLGERIAVNFNGVNSFAGGLTINSPNTNASWDSTNAVNQANGSAFNSGTIRVNFNGTGIGSTGLGSAGTGAGAGTISVEANGAIISNVGSASQFNQVITNPIVLNPLNITPAGSGHGGLFITAMASTKPGSGSIVNTFTFGGNISGNGSVLIGNDLVFGSGGAGVTIFGNTANPNFTGNTYTGITILNLSSNGTFQMGAPSALPSTTTLQFGYSAPNSVAQGNGNSNQVGSVDLNGYNQTIASLTSYLDPAAVVGGLTNTNSSPVGVQVATPILTVNGTTADVFTGGIGITAVSTGTNNLGITRTGTGSTTLGDPFNSSISTYSGPTTISGTASLIAGSSNAFSANSNFNVTSNGSGNTDAIGLDLAGYNSAVGSLAGNATGTVSTSAANVLGGATTVYLTIGGVNSSPVNFAGTIKDGSGAPLSVTKTGGGTQILSGQNTYTGPTTINGGTLQLAGDGVHPVLSSSSAIAVNANGTLSLASVGALGSGSSVSVSTAGTIAGTGTSGGSVTLFASGIVGPGSSSAVGALGLSTVTFHGGSVYNWKITDATGAAGTGFDTLDVANALTLDSSVTSGTPITVNVSSLGVMPANFNPASSYTWQIAGAGSLAGTAFNSNLFTVVAPNFIGGQLLSSFNVTASGSNIDLNYVAGSPPTLLNWTGPTNNSESGNWDTAASNWNGTPGPAAPWSQSTMINPSGNGAQFSSFTGGATVTIDAGAIATAAVVFNNTSSSNGYTIAGSGANTLGGLTGVNNGALTVQVTNAAGSDTISAPIASKLIKTGNGTLIVSGGTSNTYAGGSGDAVVINGGTLQVDANSIQNASVIDNYAALTINQTVTGSYSGTITGGGSVLVQGGAALTLSGNNTYSGGTTISGAGTAVNVSSDSNLGNDGGALTCSGGSLSTASVSAGITFNRIVNVNSTGGSITSSGSASLNVFTAGGSFVGGGTLTLNGGGFTQIKTTPFSGSGTIKVNAGTLFLGDQTNFFSDPHTYLGGTSVGSSAGISVTLAAGTELTIAAGTDAEASVTPPSLTINSSGGTVTIGLFQTGGLSGSGPLNPTLSSTTTVNGGTLRIDGGTSPGIQANPLSGSSTVTLGTTSFTGPTTIQTVANSTFQTGLQFGTGLNSSGVVTDHGNAMIFLGQGNAAGAGGSGISFNQASTTATMTGTWTIGDTLGVNAQVVTVAVPRATAPQFGMTTGAVTVNQGSELSITPIGTVPFANTQTMTLNGVGPLDSSLVYTQGALSIAGKTNAVFGANEHFILGTQTPQVEFYVNGGSGTNTTMLTINGVISGSSGGTMVVDGGGTLTNNSPAQFNINGTANVLTGVGTLIEGANTVVALGSAIGNGALTFGQLKDHSPSLVLDNVAQTVGSLNGTYSGYVDPNTMQVGVVNQTLNLNGTVLTIVQTTGGDFGLRPLSGSAPVTGDDSVITGSGSIVLAATSTAQLSLSDANNSYTGSTAINGGTLQIYTDTDLGTAPVAFAAGQLTINGGTLRISAAPVTLATTRGLTIGAGGGAITTDASATLTIPGVTQFNNPANPLTIGSGSYVKFNQTSGATNTVTGGSQITVSSGATLELAGPNAALSDGSHYVNVLNNSTAATTGGLYVSGTGQYAGTITGTGNTVVANGASLTAYQVRQNSLSIGSGATVTLSASGSASTSGPALPNNINFSSSVNSLSIAGTTNAWTGTLDIGNNGLVINYGNPANDPYSTIDNMIESGYKGGVWGGKGITSSLAQAGVAMNISTPLNIGLIDFTPGTGNYTNQTFMVFEGQTVTTNAIVVRLTYMDDLVLAGDMAQNNSTSDALLFAANYGTGTTWGVGDLTHDGAIDSNDALLFAANFTVGLPSLDGTTGNSAAFGSSAAVPEPASLALAGLASLGLAVFGFQKRHAASGRRGGAR